MSGFFCGIGEADGDYGMIFITTKYGDDENSVSLVSCLLVHPLRIKCILYSDTLDLRRTCRKIFKKFKLKNSSEDIYHPSFEIKEITNEKRIETKG